MDNHPDDDQYYEEEEFEEELDTPSAEKEMERARQKLSTMTGGAADMSQEEI